jgi:hypothetical protein
MSKSMLHQQFFLLPFHRLQHLSIYVVNVLHLCITKRKEIVIKAIEIAIFFFISGLEFHEFKNCTILLMVARKFHNLIVFLAFML